MAMMKFHPIANLFPMMETDDFQNLTTDIKAKGLQLPIWTYEGMILDGRNRYLACVDAKIEPEFREYTGDDPLGFTVSLNLERRHLTPSQRAALAVDVLPFYEKAAKERQLAGKKNLTKIFSEGNGEARSFAAEVMHVNPLYVSDAKKIKEKLPEVFEEMKAGLIHMKEAKSELKKVERAELLEKAETQEVAEFPGYGVNDVYLADIHSLELPENSVDMVFTDPPYHDEHLELFAALARFAERSLKPGGYLMSYSGKMFLPQVINALGECLEYVWMYGVFQPDSNHKIQKHHIFQAWRPIVCFKKPGKTARVDWEPDMIKATRDKSFHEWQQQIEPPLQWIDSYTVPGGLVVDPFVGGGTTLVACKRLRRNFLGFDIDPESVKLSKLRLEQE